MKLVGLLFLVLSVCTQLTRAQNATQALPACAIKCMNLHVPQSTCAMTDQMCICTNADLQETLTNCVESTCSVKEGLTTQNITSQVCDWPHHDKRSLIRRVVIPFFAIATLFFAARITARLRIFGGEFGPDDYTVGAAWLLSAGVTAVILMLADTGLGRDIWDVPFQSPNDDVTKTLQLFTAFEKLYIPAIWATKISILLLYLRVFPDSRFRFQVKICIGFFFATGFCIFMACLLKCWPVSYSWTFWDGEHVGSCSNENAQGWANAGLNVFEDLIVLILPWPTIYKLTLSKEKKIGIMIMFSVGIFVTIVSMVRLYTLKAFTFSQNPTWDFVNLCLWSAVEVYVSIMCACLPGSRNFYNRVIKGKILGKGLYASSRSNSPSSPSAKFAMAMAPAAQGHPTVLRNNSSSSSQGSAADSYSQATDLERGSIKEFVLVVNGPIEEMEHVEHGVAVSTNLKSKSDYGNSRGHPNHEGQEYWRSYEEWPTPRI